MQAVAKIKWLPGYIADMFLYAPFEKKKIWRKSVILSVN